jgi:hypothetical protein
VGAVGSSQPWEPDRCGCWIHGEDSPLDDVLSTRSDLGVHSRLEAVALYLRHET